MNISLASEKADLMRLKEDVRKVKQEMQKEITELE